ncbi:MAG: hypothetical protein NXI24_07430 [bacterium]|nr:hypothetical protein [bacterium]
MSCPAESVVMNYSLGRDVDGASRAHIARCKKCRKTMARLEGTVLAEGLAMQGQASTFTPDGGRSGKAVDEQASASASALAGW